MNMERKMAWWMDMKRNGGQFHELIEYRKWTYRNWWLKWRNRQTAGERNDQDHSKTVVDASHQLINQSMVFLPCHQIFCNFWNVIQADLKHETSFPIVVLGNRIDNGRVNQYEEYHILIVDLFSNPMEGLSGKLKMLFHLKEAVPECLGVFLK